MKQALIAGLFLLCLVTAVHAVPSLPMSVSGNVFIDGSPAPVGTVIAAHGENVYPGTALVTLTTVGRFGGDTFDQKIEVQGTRDAPLTEGATITFTVNGNPAQTTTTYTPGSAISVDLSLGDTQEPVQVSSSPVVQSSFNIEQESVDGQDPPSVPTPEPSQTPPQTQPSCVTKSTVSIYRPAKITCPGTFWYGVPQGYGILRLEGWGSGNGFYVNDVYVGGTCNMFGMVPGEYTVKWRKTRYAPTDISVEVVAGQLTEVTITEPCRVVSMSGVTSYASWLAVMNNIPNDLKWYGEPGAIGYNREYPINTEATDGSFTCDPYMDGMSVQIDDVLYAPCQIPCDFTWRLSPGFHNITYSVTNTDGSATYYSSFPIIVCAGTNTFVNGFLPSTGFSMQSFSSACGGPPANYKIYNPPADVYHGPDYHGT